jgi:hypothetical protein
MIRLLLSASQGDRLRLITQPDHAHLAGEMLSLFRLPALVTHPRREALLRAVRLHDNGWRELDAAPPVDPSSGLPYGFIELPTPQRLAVWERGAGRYAESDPYSALLAVEHARVLHADRRDREGWRELLPRLDGLREELLAACGLGEEELAADYGWLDLADALSLAACAGWEAPASRRGFGFALAPPEPALLAGGDAGATGLAVQLSLSPFPLAGATTLAVPCRVLDVRRWKGDADLGAALAAAPWRRLAVRLVPG